MTKRIFLSIFAAAVSILTAAIVMIMWVLYSYFSVINHDRLEEMTKITAHSVANEGMAFFDGLSGIDYRITWINADGSVIFDSVSGSQTLENHSDREEFIEAVSDGYGESSRYSSTLTEKRMYSAQKLPDNTVIRLSVSQFTVFSLLPEMLLPLTVIIGLAVALSLLLAYRLSKKIVRPLNELDLDEPRNNTAYSELSPLLDRIEAQQNELKDKAASLRKKQDELDTATRNMAEGFVLLNDSGIILSINDTASGLLAISSFGVGKNIYSLNTSPKLQKLLRDAQEGVRGETVIQLDGLDHRFIASPVFSGGRTAGVALLILDITEKERSEQLRREFTANVSHEIKTPLHAISGYAEIIRGGFVKPDDVLEFSDKIYSEAQRLTVLVDDIIRLSRLDEGKEELLFEETELLAAAKKAIIPLEKAARDRKVSITAAGDTVTVFSVPQLVGVIIYNLCENAIKYNRENGSVSVVVTDHDEYAQVTVSDTGIGIPAEHLDRVFERFYRVDKSRSKQVGGTGLGLSIVKHSASLLNAETEITSVVDGGTSVTVRFPKKPR